MFYIHIVVKCIIKKFLYSPPHTTVFFWYFEFQRSNSFFFFVFFLFLLLISLNYLHVLSVAQGGFQNGVCLMGYGV